MNLKTEVKWALIFIVMMLLWMTGERLTGLHDTHIEKHAIFTNFIAVPAIAIYVLALRAKRDRDLGGTMSWMQGFKSGAIITLIVAALTPLVQVAIKFVISPDFFTNMIAHATAKGMMSQEQAEAYFTLSNYLVLSTIGALVMGLATAAIVAIFVRRS